jgi:hypothetical protein
MLSLTVVGTGQLQDLSGRLRRARGTLRSELTKAFKTAGADTLRRVKRNVTTMQIRGYRAGGRPFREHRSGKGLRRRIAAVTELEVRTGSDAPRVKFVVRTDRLGDARNVPYHMDSGKRWRHPIMGHRGKWASNSGKPWFYKEIRSDLDLFKAECEKAIENTIRQIEAG